MSSFSLFGVICRVDIQAPHTDVAVMVKRVFISWNRGVIFSQIDVVRRPKRNGIPCCNDMPCRSFFGDTRDDLRISSKAEDMAIGVFAFIIFIIISRHLPFLEFCSSLSLNH